MKPRIQDRYTCLCKLHENAALMHSKLKQIKAIPNCSIEDTVRHVVCGRDTTNRRCMTNECNGCINRNLPFLSSFCLSEETAVSWHQWQTVLETIGDQRQVRKTVKRTVCGSVEQLKTNYADAVKILKPHMFTISNQYDVLAAKKANLSDNEVLVHIDYSENWTIKKLNAVQSAHFGASMEQITLHTGVAYFSNGRIMSFCTLSDNSDHGPAAVWSHLLPILIHIMETSDRIEVLHVLSDGPTTQYRNRFNFFLCSVIPNLFGIKMTWWNFTEAGHGKGPADGVGAAIKRLADRCVLSGQEITDAVSLKCALEALTTVKLFVVGPNDFISLSDTANIPPFPGTMQVHQLLALPSGQITYRRFSCYCKEDKMCPCIKAKTVFVGNVDRSGINVPLQCYAMAENCVQQEMKIQFLRLHPAYTALWKLAASSM
jgi:hypothetical protein